MTGERLLDLGGRAWPRAFQPALRLPCRLGQLAHRLVRGQEGGLQSLMSATDTKLSSRRAALRAGAAPTSTWVATAGLEAQGCEHEVSEHAFCLTGGHVVVVHQGGGGGGGGGGAFHSREPSNGRLGFAV